MTTTHKHNRIAIVGAGLSGSLMAVYLARLGYEIDIYERRGDMRQEQEERGRSINLTLAARGLAALKEVGLFDNIIKMTIPLKGRLLHSEAGPVNFQPYGRNESEVIHSVLRNDLNIALMNAAQEFANVRFHFNRCCTGLDKNNGLLQLVDGGTGEVTTVKTDLIIGADGAFSSVRQQMHRGERARYQQSFLDWGYKELTIPPGPDGSFQMSNQGLHIWPRGNRMLMAMPNFDGSFTCTCILPFGGEGSFGTLKADEQIIELFTRHFPDALPLIPMLAEGFKQNPVVEMITTCTFPWHYKDRVVLLGDACHAVVPFYGQGMNVAFEDCSILHRCIVEKDGDLETAFQIYEQLRKPHTDALGDLSTENFTELRERTKSPLFVARKQVDVFLNKLFPHIWVPLYTRISHTTMPIAEAVAKDKKQNKIARWCGIDLLLMLLAALLVVTGFFRRRHPDNNRVTLRDEAKVAPLSKSAGNTPN